MADAGESSALITTVYNAVYVIVGIQLVLLVCVGLYWALSLIRDMGYFGVSPKAPVKSSSGEKGVELQPTTKKKVRKFD